MIRGEVLRDDAAMAFRAAGDVGAEAVNHAGQLHRTQSRLGLGLAVKSLPSRS
jgi:hypothetical protein